MSDIKSVKDINGHHIEAFVNKLGGIENFVLGLRHDCDLILQPRFPKYFDKNGHGIPENLTATVCDSNKDYTLTQPDVLSNVFLAGCFVRAKNYLGDYLGRGMISYGSYQELVNIQVAKLKADESVANLLKGVWLPIIIPPMVIDDIGRSVETIVEAAGASYKDQYQNRKWENELKGKLAGNVTIIEGTRHDRLISQIAENSVVGIYFPNALQGFSVNAQREFVQRLPEGFSLTGAIEPSVALAMYPTVLAHGNKTPVYDCSALQYKPTYAEQSFYFGANDGRLEFDHKVGLIFENGTHSGGLLFVG